MTDCPWGRFGTDFPSKEWMQGQPAGVKWAYFELVLHVRAHCPSQKKPGKSASMPVAKAARTWEVLPSEVEEMIQLASDAGDLIVSDGAWEIADKTHFVSQRTLDSLKTADHSEILHDSADFAEIGATLYNTTQLNSDTKEISKEETLQMEPEGEKPKKKERDPARTWRVVAQEWSELEPEKASSIVEWCKYKAEIKHPPFTPSTIRKKVKRYAGWSPQRFEEGVSFSIQKPYEDIYDDPKNDPERRARYGNGKPSSNGVHHTPATITVEQAQAMLTGEGLEDRGSPIQRRKPAEGQN